jgi:hypothetical protein
MILSILRNCLCTRTSVPPYIDVPRPLEDKGKYDSPLRHLGVATIYHLHLGVATIYHRGGDFAIAVAMTRAMVISDMFYVLHTPKEYADYIPHTVVTDPRDLAVPSREQKEKGIRLSGALCAKLGV